MSTLTQVAISLAVSTPVLIKKQYLDPLRHQTCCKVTRPVGHSLDSACCHSPSWQYTRCIGKSAITKFFVITVYGSEFIDETERPKSQVMRAIETLSEAYMWENFWHIFAPVYL